MLRKTFDFGLFSLAYFTESFSEKRNNLEVRGSFIQTLMSNMILIVLKAFAEKLALKPKIDCEHKALQFTINSSQMYDTGQKQ